MTDTNVKILAKGCASTGVTDDLASEMFNAKGRRYMAIVEVKVRKTHEDDDGNRDVDLSIESFEPVVDGKLNGAVEEAVRRIERALFMNRRIAEGDPELPLDEDQQEPSVPEVLAAAAALVETDDAGEVTGLWDGDKTRELEDSTT